MIWFGLVLWHYNHCRLFNDKFSLYIYIKHIWVGLVGFYRISYIISYLILNHLYMYILNIYYLVWFGLVLLHINHYSLFDIKYIYIKYILFGLVSLDGMSTNIGYLMLNPLHTYILKYMICKYILLITFLHEPKVHYFSHC